MENLEEMDKFLERYNFTRMNQEQMENMNRPITSTEIETEIKYFQKTKVQDQVASQVILSNIQKLFQKLQRTLPCSFYEATITLIPKSQKKTIIGQYH